MRRTPTMLLSVATTSTRERQGGTVGVTPHDSYSSSVGILGCKINTNRVAYWPLPVDCESVCVSLAYGGRRIHLLRVDQSGGAHDVSYDAWNYLYNGSSAVERPVAGGSVDMEFEYVDEVKCRDLIHTDDGSLPLSAANSVNFVTSCLRRPDSWVARHHALFNILDSICTLGHDEQCKLDWPDANQPTCFHILGDPAPLRNAPVYNIRYPTGEKILASLGRSGGGDDGSLGSTSRRLGSETWALGLCGLLLHVIVLLCPIAETRTWRNINK